MTRKSSFSDVIIIGGGPAGLSAAQWCCELGLETVLLDKAAELGGQLQQIYNPIENYLGIRSNNGLDLLGKFHAAIHDLKFARILNAGISSADLQEKLVRLAGGREFASKTIIIATGVRRRKLGVEGEDRFRGKGILESGSKERESVSGKRVVIVGGGDAAIENALILSEYASAVTVVHRRAEFTARPKFLEHANRTANIEFLTKTIVRRINGSEKVEAIELAETESGNTGLYASDHILIRIGVEPNTDIFREQIELDAAGYVIVDGNCETSVKGVFAAGDAASPAAQTIITAAGMGATAAKTARLMI